KRERRSLGMGGVAQLRERVSMLVRGSVSGASYKSQASPTRLFVGIRRAQRDREAARPEAGRRGHPRNRPSRSRRRIRLDERLGRQPAETQTRGSKGLVICPARQFTETSLFCAERPSASRCAPRQSSSTSRRIRKS